MSRLEARGELTDEEILEIIDDLVLSRRREFLLTLKEKSANKKSSRNLRTLKNLYRLN